MLSFPKPLDVFFIDGIPDMLLGNLCKFHGFIAFIYQIVMRNG